MLDEALRYAALGWHVHPIHTIYKGRCTCFKPNCRNPGKHPATENGLKDATTDPETIREWWSQGVDYNLAIATGPSGLVVVDVDPRHEGDLSWNNLAATHGKDTLMTVRCTTGGGGMHFYYKAPTDKPIPNSAGRLGRGIDVRGDGGYVLAPPSTHHSGGIYEWRPGGSPFERDIIPFPDVLRAELDSLTTAPPAPTVIRTGERNVTLMSLAGTLNRRGLHFDEIYACLDVVNRRRGRPPVTEPELRSIIQNVLHYQAADPIPDELVPKDD